MKHIALKAFPYAHDGIRNRDLAEGDVFEIREGLEESFEASGLSREATDAEIAAGAKADAAAAAAEADPAAVEAAPAPKAGKVKPAAKA